MTYCIGIKTKDGIVVASDSRTNAGLDNVNIYSKMFTYDVGDRTVLIVTSGNLGTSQAVYKSIEKDLEDNSGKKNLNTISHVLGNISLEEKSILDKVYRRVIESLEQLNTKKEEYIMNELNSFDKDQI